VQGDARDPASERLLYREQHFMREQDDQLVERLVVYRCPNGTAFARKHVDYRVSRTAPDFELTDARRGYREGLRRRDGATQTWSGSAAPSAVSAKAGTLVADVGFDEFLRAHWGALLSGAPQTMAFVVPSLRRALPFQVRSLGRGDVNGQSVERFHLKLEGLLGLIGPSMDVDYDTSAKRLRRFVGITNLHDDRGKPMRAQIDFPSLSRAADPGQWQAALDTPLAACALGR
ncbi:MAG: hypothetical protein ABJA62_05310, partial [Luteimonas sp.]